VLACSACGGLPQWLEQPDAYYLGMEPIPVSVNVETCSNPGGWHGLQRCDCTPGIVITPRRETLQKVLLAATVALEGRLNSGSQWDQGYQAFARIILGILGDERHPEYPAENAGAPPGTIQEQ